LRRGGLKFHYVYVIYRNPFISSNVIGGSALVRVNEELLERKVAAPV
jgi:hypothetical protein